MQGFPFPVWLLAYAIGVNLYAYWLMFSDKSRARQNQWRVSEGRLLFWSLIGGALGAKLAQRRFRHKTRKQPFAGLLMSCFGLNLMGYPAVLAVWWQM